MDVVCLLGLCLASLIPRPGSLECLSTEQNRKRVHPLPVADWLLLAVAVQLTASPTHHHHRRGTLSICYDPQLDHQWQLHSIDISKVSGKEWSKSKAFFLKEFRRKNAHTPSYQKVSSRSILRLISRKNPG